MMKGENKQKVSMETCGRSRKNSKLKDILSALECRVNNLEESMGGAKETLEALNVGMDDQTNKLVKKHDALEAMVTTLKEQVVKLKGKLIICKVVLGNRMLASGPKQHRMDVLKSK
ncbi:hypothetical protein J1N35_010480 [Gossypium stocksii]|uniref:Uncharacterized protein n=1 Tax=Gossypium stocksii TaxID=47602 RepID=A0A9D3W169_9ROSI|nr:hypothetical protein J1N35_010480 [Gossypium stocksii]